MKALHALRKKLNHHGATLMEMLLSVALLVVLLGVVSISIASLTRKLRQTELDSKAETIYTAAQNQLAALRTAGCESLYAGSADGVIPLNRVPMGADSGTIKADTLSYIVHNNGTVSGAVSSILPSSCVESEIWDKNWVIEYSPASGSVYAVFYSESALSYSPDSFDVFRSRENRIDGGAAVGYYGGDSVQLANTYKLTPTMTLSNGEKLVAEISCTAPSDERLRFLLEVSDGTNTVEKDITSSVALSGARRYTCSYVLDAAKPGQHFSELFSQLTPGADITVKLTVKSTNPLVDSGTVNSPPCNSLFASVDGNTAVITCCRHLQNLDQSSSGVGTLIENAQQRANLYFADDAANDKDWYSYYGANAFTPITNSSLRTYTGSYVEGGETVHTVIYGLTTDDDASSGLFSSFSGDLTDVWLSGTLLSHHATYSGALAGTVTGSTKIDGCRVFLDRTADDLANKDSGDVWIDGSYAGGLVGFVNGGDLTVQDSFAASVVGTGTSKCAGGLIGLSAGDVIIRRSYADCYLTGNNTGGLVASTTDMNRVTLSDCYTAGYQNASASAAGLVNGSTANMTNVYSAERYSAQCVENPDVRLYSTAIAGAAANHTYYLSEALPIGTHHIDGTTDLSYAQMHDLTAFAGTLGTAFTGSTGGHTVPYNLEQQGLSDYSFPRLANLPHYGDWSPMGLFWERSHSEMDLLRDFDETAQRSRVSLALSVRGAGFDGTQTPTFTYIGGEDIAKVDSCVYLFGHYHVVVEGLKPGVVSITAQITVDGQTYYSTTVLTVTADLIVTAAPAAVTLQEGSDADITLTAKSKPLVNFNGTDGTKDYTPHVTWSFHYDDASVAVCTPAGGTGNAYTVSALHQGKSIVYITGTLNLGGHIYTGTGKLTATTTRATLVGLASTSQTPGYYNQMPLAAGGSGAYVSPASFAGGDLPALGGESLFLYAGGTGVHMAGISITKAEVKPAADADSAFRTIYENGVPVSNIPYYRLSIGSSQSGTKYDYLPLQLQGGSDADVMLRLTLRWAGSENAASRYTLTVPVHITGITVNAVFLNSDGTTFTTQAVPLGGTPDLTALTGASVGTSVVAEGYHYLLSPDDPNFWLPDIAAMTESSSFRPKAYANTGVVHYEANAASGFTGATADQPVRYDSAAAAANCGFSCGGYTFIGWTESAASTTADYAANGDISALVKRKTASGDGVGITLYAVWQPAA